MADNTNVPNRKVVVGAAAGGLITFVSVLLKAIWGFELDASAWLGLQTFAVFVIQYVVPNAEV